MSEKLVLTNRQIFAAAKALWPQIEKFCVESKRPARCYGVPRGGIPALYALAGVTSNPDHAVYVTEVPDEADFIIDDIIDSGGTMQRYAKYPGKFIALFQRGVNLKDEWLVFPWEGSEVGSIEDSTIRLLQYIGEDPKRGGLLETPSRVAKAWKEWCSGYNADPKELLKVFEDGAEGYDEMVVVRDLPFYSHCEHHMAAFFGTVTVGYIPNGKIVGLSKLPRVVEIFSRRLQVQERMTNQIADAVETGLAPKGVGVVVTARHLCMESRGVGKQGHSTTTSALRGVMRTNDAARNEFLRFLR